MCGTSTSIDSNGSGVCVKTAAGSSFARKLNLSFWYISDEGKHVYHKDQAQVTVRETSNAAYSVGFLVECAYDALLTSGIEYTLDYASVG